MRKVKNILTLYHQFSGYLKFPKLSAYEIADALEAQGLIEFVAFESIGDDRLPTHYRETERLWQIPPDSFRVTVQNALRAPCELASSRAKPAFVQLTGVRFLKGRDFEAKVRAGDLEPKERRALKLKRHEADLELTVTGEVEVTGRRDEIELYASDSLTVWHGDLHIDVTLARFDSEALDDGLRETFDFSAYEADAEGDAIDAAYEAWRDREMED